MLIISLWLVGAVGITTQIFELRLLDSVHTIEVVFLFNFNQQKLFLSGSLRPNMNWSVLENVKTWNDLDWKTSKFFSSHLSQFILKPHPTPPPLLLHQKVVGDNRWRTFDDETSGWKLKILNVWHNNWNEGVTLRIGDHAHYSIENASFQETAGGGHKIGVNPPD